MLNFKRHFIPPNLQIKDALAMLNSLASDAILFVVTGEGQLLGSLTDGDIRRGLLRGLSIENEVIQFIEPNPKFIRKGNYQILDIISYRERNFKILPIIDEKGKVVNIINFRLLKSYLPVDVVIMAGGRGQRLRPLTDENPKPLLKIADKPIIEYNIERLASFGIENFWISVQYLGEKIRNYFNDGSEKDIHIKYINEEEPLGTIGAISEIREFVNEYVLVTNSDILTNIDYEDFYCSFLNSEADICIATIPYTVNVPYAIIETDNDKVTSLKEKPTFTYYANAGIYLIKKSLVELVPKNSFYNATDLVENCIAKKMKVISYPLRGYWLDIGNPEDFAKAQQDIYHIKF